jgi:hypothetical protein
MVGANRNKGNSYLDIYSNIKAENSSKLSVIEVSAFPVTFPLYLWKSVNLLYVVNVTENSLNFSRFCFTLKSNHDTRSRQKD